MVMQTVPNQRTIRYSDFDYTNFPVDAVRRLPPPALQFYMYLWSMKPACKNNILVLYSSHVEKDIGISRNTYSKAFNILVSGRFLVQDKGNNFTFYPGRFAISNEEMLRFVEGYIQYDYWKQKIKPFENEYSQTYYDGGYRYPDPTWQIAGNPEELNVEIEDISCQDMDYMKAWDEPQETPF